NGNNPNSFGVTDVGLDPLDPTTVYASAFDQGVWRRSPSLDGTSSPTAFKQVFAPQFPGGGVDRTMFAATVQNNKTRIYLTDGTAASSNPLASNAANFWRTDNAGLTAAALLASQAAGSTVPPDTTVGPQVYNGWQKLSSNTTASPYYATINFCTGQCWYDENVYTPAGLPDTVYVIGSYNYGEQPCNTKGVGCGSGRSNGRAVLYSTTAGDPESVTPVNSTPTTRTFTDLTYDMQNTPASWCGLGAAFEETFGPVSPGFTCLWAPNNIHPDQHTIVVNPSNPTQIFEGSDGGVIRTDGAFGDLSFRCNSNERAGLGAASLNNGKRLLSRAPNLIPPIDKNFENGDPTKWVAIWWPLATSGEAVGFYWPQIGDPNPPSGAHPIFSGLQHVWRSWAFGAGANPTAVPQNTTPDIANYEANCPELNSFGQPGCGDFQPLGGAVGSNNPGDLTGTVYGSDRTGGAISWLARNKADHGTLWATTSAGRIFVTHNADASNPASVSWHRIDNATSPTRFPSSIYPDPANVNHAWITYSGYNATTPTVPGHVFEALEG